MIDKCSGKNVCGGGSGGEAGGAISRRGVGERVNQGTHATELFFLPWKEAR